MNVTRIQKIKLNKNIELSIFSDKAVMFVHLLCSSYILIGVNGELYCLSKTNDSKSKTFCIGISEKDKQMITFLRECRYNVQ